MSTIQVLLQKMCLKNLNKTVKYNRKCSEHSNLYQKKFFLKISITYFMLKMKKKCDAL